MKIRAFITHKAKEHITDCQDRFSVNTETKIVAISDGVSQSIFPDYWAELLVGHFCEFGTLTEQERRTLCNQWVQKVQNYISEEKKKGNNPWRTESNLNEGISAGATLCGVKFEDADKWCCNVIGDSCLITVDANYNIEILSSEDKNFDNEPDYLDSLPRKKGRGNFKTFCGTISESKRLILVSDPFSDFFYKHKPEAPQFIRQILDVKSHEEFTSLVDDWRHLGMKGDDSTIIIVEWDNSSDLNVVAMDNIHEMIDKEYSGINNLINSETNLVQIENSPESLKEENDLNSTSQNDNEQDTQNPAQECTTKTSEINSEIEVLKKKLKDGIPQFVDDYVSAEIKKLTGCRSIIRFIFSKRNKKENELKSLLSSVLNAFVDSI